MTIMSYTPPVQLKGVSRYGTGILLSVEQTRMVYLMLGIIDNDDGERLGARYDAARFWFNGRGYGKTTTLLTAARYAEAANIFWTNGSHSSLSVMGLDMEFLNWYCDEEEHI